MAYTPDAATQAALAKSRSGQRLTPAEQALLTKHSQNTIAQMGAQPASGDGYQSYLRFLDEEKTRRAQGLAPRQLPSTFVPFLQTNNPLGYGAADGSDIMNIKPAGMVSSAAQVSQGSSNVVSGAAAPPVSGTHGVIKYTPALPGPYGTPAPYVPPTGVGSTPQNPAIGSTPVVGAPVAGSNAPPPPFNLGTATPSAPQTVQRPGGGLELGPTAAGNDEGKILAEAEMQKQLAGQTNENQAAGRKAMLSDLSTLLQQQQAGALNDQMPGIYEDLNTRGLLRSSALGEKVGLEAAKLTRQTSEQLAQQGLADRGTAIDALSGIENNYLGQRNSALQRRFSLEDFDRQLAAGKALGANALPQVSTPSAKGSSALQGGLGGATVGASVGGPTGAVIGGLAGLVGGGKLGSK